MFVYILECEDGSYYTGIAKNLAKRLTNHGKGSKYTRAKKPIKLVYVEMSDTARQREYAIKQLSRSEKETLLSSASNQVGDHQNIIVS
jgi:putative endonuclease